MGFLNESDIAFTNSDVPIYTILFSPQESEITNDQICIARSGIHNYRVADKVAANRDKYWLGTALLQNGDTEYVKIYTLMEF